eukprot:1394163-Amorphochlora_amoeboformis.AAC.1
MRHPMVTSRQRGATRMAGFLAIVGLLALFSVLYSRPINQGDLSSTMIARRSMMVTRSGRMPLLRVAAGGDEPAKSSASKKLDQKAAQMERDMQQNKPPPETPEPLFDRSKGRDRYNPQTYFELVNDATQVRDRWGLALIIL